MNKIITVLIILLFYTSVYSQEHLKFKNIPITGNINDFAKELVKQGYEILSSEGDVVIMKGEFLGQKNCMISVLGSSKSHIATQVIILLPAINIWSSLKVNYFDIKEQYKAKYGTPSSDDSFFTTPYFEGDGYELQALKANICTYVCYWETETSMIGMKIHSSQQIMIFYSNTQNDKIKEKERKEAISNEI